MRQLDLFSSLFDSPPADEGKVASKKQDSEAPAKDVPVKEEQEIEAAQEVNDNKELQTEPAELSFPDRVAASPETAPAEMPTAEKITEIIPEKAEVVDKAKPEGTLFQDEKIGIRIKEKPAELAESIITLPPDAGLYKKKPSRVVEAPKKPKAKRTPQKRGRKSFKEIDAELDLVDVPDDESLFKKQYYPIGEVAKWFAVNTSLLRFWENEFDVLKPRKNRKGDRLFRPEDVKNLQLIYQLLRQRKYTIEGAKEYIKSHKKKADMQLQLTTTLKKFKNFLLELKSTLQ
jgi:DNA-binding transcriptional MerR regulator